ncbi:hypothetical protein OESDEN_23706, partial [Oesophagostomum dentatum]
LRLFQEYSRSRNELQRKDDEWVRKAVRAQQKALHELKLIDPELYEKLPRMVIWTKRFLNTDKAVTPAASSLPLVVHGPGLTPPVEDYQSPDGDYLDTTRSWT